MTQRIGQQTATPPTEHAPTEFEKLLRGSVSYKPFAETEEIKVSPQIILKYLCKPTRGGHYPTEQDIMRFQMLCRSRKLNPFEGDAFLVGFDSQDGAQFSIITAIQALYKRAESSPDYDGIDSGAIVQNAAGEIVDRPGDFTEAGDTLLGGWAIVYRKNQSHPTKERLNLASRDKKRSVWNTDKSGMIAKCAEAAALRRAFPSQLSGMYLAGEIQRTQTTSDEDPDADLAKPRGSQALADRLKQAQAPTAAPASSPEAPPVAAPAQPAPTAPKGVPVVAGTPIPPTPVEKLPREQYETKKDGVVFFAKDPIGKRVYCFRVNYDGTGPCGHGPTKKPAFEALLDAEAKAKLYSAQPPPPEELPEPGSVDPDPEEAPGELEP